MGLKRFCFQGTDKRGKGFLSVLLSVLLVTVGNTAFPVFAGEKVTVEYENLRQLLLEGNLDLQQANDSYESRKENYQKLMEELREEQAYMKFLAEKYEDTEDEAVYRSNAGILGAQATRISKQLEGMNRRTQTLAVEENTDTYTMSAQSLMNSYNQMVLHVTASQKSLEAAEAAWEAAGKKQLAGAATAAETAEAADRLSRQQNLLASYQQRAGQLRFQLLSVLGLSEEDEVIIHTLPEPDLEEIDRINYEEDKTAAINNHQEVQSVRHSRAGTTAEISRKAVQETEAVGKAEAEFLSVYQELQAARSQYLAALDARESAVIRYASLQLKQQAGMLSQSEYLEGEAEYLEEMADYGEASMNLTAAWESYRWAVKGIKML